MAGFGRIFKGAAIASIVALSVTACSSDDGGDTSASEDTTAGVESRGPIKFAMGKNDVETLKPFIEQWNAEHPDEEVTLHELPGDQDGQRDTLVQSLQAKSGEYDVFALDITDTAHFAANDWIQPIEGDTAVDTSGLLPAAVESATYNGTLYAVPQNTNAQLLYYRTDMQPEAPANWQALVDSCTVAFEANVDCLQMPLNLGEQTTVAASQFINSWGGAIVGEDGATPEVESEQSRAGLQALVDGYQSDVIAKKTDSFSEEETALGFLAGETMYSYNWPYMYDKALTEGQPEVAENFDVAPILGPDGAGASTLGGYNNAISVFSENKATAVDFVQYIISEEVQMGFAQASFPPVLASIYDNADLQAEFPYMTALKVALENAKPRPVTPFYPAVSKAVQDNTHAALKDEKSVDQATTDMAAAIQQAGN
ncbi:ABC transporter substrate-binding protein [uncultured Dietzia sp.]|uniref:ABC transporter substrate-binding protein n=1 Tax=uncultured Dietzia sp. TaxID=395519 RepID=UPI0025FABFBC|nr:ABC transporter substrate-binding protein [uncultured Dietzia sp.]